MKMPENVTLFDIAPCGVNCLACSARLDPKKPCPGCRAPDDQHKRKSCVGCAKKKCAFGQGLRWCFECARFPCARIKSLGKRYIQNYGVDLVQNGRDMARDGAAFLLKQRERFLCPCGGVIDQHRGRCSACGTAAPGRGEAPEA